MKLSSRISFRAAVTALLAVLAGGLLWAGVPVLAADAAQNSSPVAENLSYNTFRDIPVKGQLSASDPEGDALTFEIADLPKKGIVQTEGDGSFVYTPEAGKKGQDSFSYIAVDTAGNLSDKGIVTISINKQSTKLTYADMADNGSYYSALVLAEKGILTGEKLGSEYFFRPDATVTRGEFLAMCLAMDDTKTLPGITRTGFSDDASIPMWVKPYVSTALMSGIITGFRDGDGQLIFAPQEPITMSEAAVVLNNVLKVSDVEAVDAISQDVCPAWAYQAEVNLSACNILQPAAVQAVPQVLTRAQAADMLVASMEVVNARDSGGSLLSWLK
ncbi:S-layer homology domain-containing protein [Sporobacter termitidis DSM 10068]|uniref:S-layer homology domain-containing protein n=1 Tax=Sporobacter termitidis DSM 10068 TaxID=1123282 RepID=A0A1M5TLR7_9FIRM|nr:Ig-like domain-containing protein [Sporobacter termitidis]SHH51765.1 S-layer homology domain-containing protein [Sporobacter termitidis DSM 10068]